MAKLIGTEVGNYDTKLMTCDKTLMKLMKDKEPVEIGKGYGLSVLNIISPGKDRRQLGINKSSDLINLLDVTITTKDKTASGRWFVGGLALKEGIKKFKPTRDDEKAKNPMTIVMMLTTLAYALYDPTEPKKKEIISLATLLPTEEYFKSDKIDDYLAKLKGEHKVVFNDSNFNSAEITIKINDIELLTEGGAGQVAIMYDFNGELNDPSYESKTVMNIDIGSIDTDISVMENGNFLSKGFFGIKGGTLDVVREVSRYIKDKYDGYSIDTHKLDYHILNNVPLRIGGQEQLDLAEISESYFENAAWVLSNQIIEALRDREIDRHALNEVNVIGGGITFYESGLKKHFETGDMKINVPEHARFKNVEGALKSLVFKKMTSTEQILAE